MRSNSGHTLRELARRAKTSAPALVDYEAGRHEPKLSTLQRIADAAGCDLIVEVRPRLTRPERRTLELHKLVAEKLRADPQDVIQRAKARIDVMRSRDPEGRSASYINTWDRLLSGPIDELEAAMTSTDQASRDLRQSSPFGGTLSDEERLDVLNRVAADDRIARAIQWSGRIWSTSFALRVMCSRNLRWSSWGPKILGAPYEGLPKDVTLSVEVDVMATHDPDGSKALRLNGAIGAMARFDDTYGYYAEGVEVGLCRFPGGWRERLMPVESPATNGVIGPCVEPHDLCASKLLAGRDKDLK
jgi:transcriptional regulator with XRE-family HTH domain